MTSSRVVAQVEDERQAVELARRMTAAVRRKTSVTVSIGVSVADAGDPLTGAFARADKALYAAKSDGRDSVMLLR